MTRQVLFAVALTTMTVAGSTSAAQQRFTVAPAPIIPVETAVTEANDNIVLVRGRGSYRQGFRRDTPYYSNRAPAYRNFYRPNSRNFYYRPYYYRPYYGSQYYGTPRFGYFNYGYLGGGVRIGPLQIWW